MTDIQDKPFGSGLLAGFENFDVLEAARCLTMIATLLCVLVTLDPFPDLGNPDVTSFVSGRLTTTYIAFGGLAVVAVLLAASANRAGLRTLLTPLHLCFAGWMILNIAFSENPELSLQRFMLTAAVMSLAIMMPLLPTTQTEFNRCFGAAGMALLALCYLGIIFAPKLSIHNAADIGDPLLAGDWRGSFEHKNLAAPVMTILIYFSIYLISIRSLLSGSIILVSAGVFLFFTGGKTASALCVAIYVLASLVGAVKGLWLQRAICFVPLLVMNFLTVGSVVSETAANIVKKLPFDSSYTGRTEIWEFALDAFREKPFIGHGYAAFWDNMSGRQTAEGAEWTVTAAHSHNSYLDLALTIGWPGLLLVVLIFVLSPLNNFHRIQSHQENSSLAKFFLAIWLFCLYFGTTETFMLDRQNPTWFMFVLAVAGLHFLARFRVRDHQEND
jgi:O-antigen ligase